MIVELFSRSSQIGSYIIRAHPSEWGEWSHCCYLDPMTNLVVESVWPKGVRIISFDEWLRDGHKTAWTERQRTYSPRVWRRAASQDGKPYDTGGVLGMGINRDWQDPNKWWCSELNEWAAQQEGYGVYVPEHVRRVGVQDRWVIA